MCCPAREEAQKMEAETYQTWDVPCHMPGESEHWPEPSLTLVTLRRKLTFRISDSSMLFVALRGHETSVTPGISKHDFGRPIGIPLSSQRLTSTTRIRRQGRHGQSHHGSRINDSTSRSRGKPAIAARPANVAGGLLSPKKPLGQLAFFCQAYLIVVGNILTQCSLGNGSLPVEL